MREGESDELSWAKELASIVVVGVNGPESGEDDGLEEPPDVIEEVGETSCWFWRN